MGVSRVGSKGVRFLESDCEPLMGEVMRDGAALEAAEDMRD